METASNHIEVQNNHCETMSFPSPRSLSLRRVQTGLQKRGGALISPTLPSSLGSDCHWAGL